LLLSGIGPEAELSRLDIEVKARLDGVGENLQDHPIAGLFRRCLEPVTLRNATGPASLLRYAFTRRGPLSSNIAEAGAFVRSPLATAAPDIQFHVSPGLFLDHGRRRPPFHGFSLGPTLVSPRSRGHIRLRSKDPFDAPLIFGRHLSEPSDLQALLWGMELARDIVANVPAVDRNGLESYVRRSAELLYHPCGTCRMGTDAQSVVDPRLRVRGVRGLSVADASVMPVIPRGNTHAPTVMIAERLASWLDAG
jgi:choline dehydrogenase